MEVSIIIPDTGAVQCKMELESIVEFDILPVIPSKGSLPRMVDPDTIPYTFNETYYQDEWYPTNSYELHESFVIWDYRGITVRLNVFQHKPVSKKLKVAREFKIVITYEKPQFVYRDSISESFAEIYNEFFLNFSPDRYGALL